LKVLSTDPAAIVAVAGTFATFGLLLLSCTTTPPAGAPELRLTVPCAVAPPLTVEGETVTAASCHWKVVEIAAAIGLQLAPGTEIPPQLRGRSPGSAPCNSPCKLLPLAQSHRVLAHHLPHASTAGDAP
jgi:hypothetical protein